MSSAALAQEVGRRISAGARVVVVIEPDEQLALEQVEAAVRRFREPEDDEDSPDYDRNREPTERSVVYLGSTDPSAQAKLQELRADEGNTQVLVLSDWIKIYGENPSLNRVIREIALQTERRLILVEQPGTEVPAGFRGDAELVTASLPGVEDLLEELEQFLTREKDRIKLPQKNAKEQRYRLASAVAGLPRHEAAMLFSRCLVDTKGLDAGWLRSAKAQRVKDRLGGALSFESSLSADVGGLGNLKAWLAARKVAFASSAAKEFGLPEPKGVLFLGIPGCGKSLMAKTVAREWELPLIRLDAGKLFGSLVGASESNTRQAIEAAEASAPCVLWIDEVEKALGGVGSASTDSGTTQRVFGTLLTWLQEKAAAVFVVCTANRVKALPPELLRKGRFDEIFFVDLPGPEEREEIARIHLERRNRKPDAAQKIAEATDGYSGAEIEQAVVEALFDAYAQGRDIEAGDVLKAVRETTPLSKTMGEEIKELRDWSTGRARPASAPSATPKKSTKPRAGRRPRVRT